VSGIERRLQTVGDSVKWRAFIPPQLLSALLFGCSSLPSEPIIEYRTVEIVRDRYVAVPERMTVPVDTVQLAEDFDVYALGAAYKMQKVRIEQCNGQLAEIAGLKE